MTSAVLYARVSSREQEREGYSIPAQRKLLAEYARVRGISIEAEFVDVESAKNPGRKEFGKMMQTLDSNGECRIVLVEKTDRLYRNRTDALAFETLIEKRGVEIHLVKEARVIGKNSRSQDKFMHDIHVAVAKHYVDNLRDEVRKGMREKAEQGIFPGFAPFGYRNNKLARTIEIDPAKSCVVKRIFELYATGQFNVRQLAKTMFDETGIRFSRSYLEYVLKNRFYLGYFVWQKVEYRGTHPPLISPGLFSCVQDVFSGRNKPKYRKHDFAFAGLLTCARDGCTVTAELHKGKYIYYRCSQGRGKCDLPYMREERVSQHLGELLDRIYVPETVATTVLETLRTVTDQSEKQQQERVKSIQQRLAAVRARLAQIYEDKLDGKIDEGFWSQKMREYREQEHALEATLSGASTPISSETFLSAQRIFELASNARFLWVARDPAGQGELLKKVLLNCATDGVSLWPTYRKPYQMIFERAKNEEWWAL